MKTKFVTVTSGIKEYGEDNVIIFKLINYDGNKSKLSECLDEARKAYEDCEIGFDSLGGAVEYKLDEYKYEYETITQNFEHFSI